MSQRKIKLALIAVLSLTDDELEAMQAKFRELSEEKPSSAVREEWGAL